MIQNLRSHSWGLSSTLSRSQGISGSDSPLCSEGSSSDPASLLFSASGGAPVLILSPSNSALSHLDTSFMSHQSSWNQKTTTIFKRLNTKCAYQTIQGSLLISKCICPISSETLSGHVSKIFTTLGIVESRYSAVTHTYLTPWETSVYRNGMTKRTNQCGQIPEKGMHFSIIIYVKELK